MTWIYFLVIINKSIITFDVYCIIYYTFYKFIFSTYGRRWADLWPTWMIGVLKPSGKELPLVGGPYALMNRWPALESPCPSANMAASCSVVACASCSQANMETNGMPFVRSPHIVLGKANRSFVSGSFFPRPRRYFL